MENKQKLTFFPLLFEKNADGLLSMAERPVLINVCITFRLLQHVVSAKKCHHDYHHQGHCMGDTELNLQFSKTNQSKVPVSETVMWAVIHSG